MPPIDRSSLRDLWRVLEEDRQRLIEQEIKNISDLFLQESKEVEAALAHGHQAVMQAIHLNGPRWKNLIQNIWVKMGHRYGNVLLDRFQKSWQPFGFIRQAARHARTAANIIVATTKRRVGRLVSEMGDKALDDLNALYTHWSHLRARFITENEVRGGVGSAEEEAARQSRRPIRKTWISMQDELVRDTHQEFDGTSKGLTGEWAPGLRYPRCSSAAPEEILGCRCHLVWT